MNKFLDTTLEADARNGGGGGGGGDGSLQRRSGAEITTARYEIKFKLNNQ